jgi:hypothetical protein
MLVASAQGFSFYFAGNINDVERRHPYIVTYYVVFQILASVAANLLVLDLGMAITVTTVLIAATLNAKEDISIDEDQASWLGKITQIL